MILKKNFYIGVTNSKELEKVTSTDYLINSFFKKNKNFFTVLPG